MLRKSEIHFFLFLAIFFSLWGTHALYDLNQYLLDTNFKFNCSKSSLNRLIVTDVKKILRVAKSYKLKSLDHCDYNLFITSEVDIKNPYKYEQIIIDLHNDLKKEAFVADQIKSVVDLKFLELYVSNKNITLNSQVYNSSKALTTNLFRLKTNGSFKDVIKKYYLENVTKINNCNLKLFAPIKENSINLLKQHFNCHEYYSDISIKSISGLGYLFGDLPLYQNLKEKKESLLNVINDLVVDLTDAQRFHIDGMNYASLDFLCESSTNKSVLIVGRSEFFKYLSLKDDFNSKSCKSSIQVVTPGYFLLDQSVAESDNVFVSQIPYFDKGNYLFEKLNSKNRFFYLGHQNNFGLNSIKIFELLNTDNNVVKIDGESAFNISCEGSNGELLIYSDRRFFIWFVGHFSSKFYQKCKQSISIYSMDDESQIDERVSKAKRVLIYPEYNNNFLKRILVSARKHKKEIVLAKKDFHVSYQSNIFSRESTSNFVTLNPNDSYSSIFNKVYSIEKLREDSCKIYGISKLNWKINKNELSDNICKALNKKTIYYANSLIDAKRSMLRSARYPMFYKNNDDRESIIKEIESLILERIESDAILLNKKMIDRENYVFYYKDQENIRVFDKNFNELKDFKLVQ